MLVLVAQCRSRKLGRLSAHLGLTYVFAKGRSDDDFAPKQRVDEVRSNEMGVEKFKMMTLLAPLSSNSGLIECG